MKGTLNIMFDYCYIPLGTYFKLGSCQISKNSLICVFGVRDLGKTTYSRVKLDRMPPPPQIMHMRCQHDRGNLIIMLVYHKVALRDRKCHNLGKC